MSQYSSKTPRDLNHDPRPLSTIGTGRRVREGSDYPGQVVWNPRSGFDHELHHPTNPVLTEFRRVIWPMLSVGWLASRWTENDFTWEQHTQTSEYQPIGNRSQRAHARRVLERLARLWMRQQYEQAHDSQPVMTYTRRPR